MHFDLFVCIARSAYSKHKLLFTLCFLLYAFPFLNRSRQRLRKKIILNAFVLLNIAVQLLNRIPAAC